MQLAFSAWAMPQLPVERQIEIVRNAGYAGIELVAGLGSSLYARAQDQDQRPTIRRLLDESHLTLTSIAAHGNLLEPDPEKRRANEAVVRAGIDLAADLAGTAGPPCVVCMGYGHPEAYETERESIARNFAVLAEYAAPREVVVALEPHVGQAMDLPERVQWLMQRVSSSHLRLNLDNSHFEVMGCHLDSYLSALVPYAVHTHLKDQRGRSPHHEFLVPGEGDFEYARYFKAMAAAGYRGAITVEISAMVHRRPGYDPAEVAQRSFSVLIAAAQEAGVSLEHHAQP